MKKWKWNCVFCLINKRIFKKETKKKIRKKVKKFCFHLKINEWICSRNFFKNYDKSLCENGRKNVCENRRQKSAFLLNGNAIQFWKAKRNLKKCSVFLLVFVFNFIRISRLCWSKSRISLFYGLTKMI